MTLAIKTAGPPGLAASEWNAIQPEIENRTKVVASKGNSGSFLAEAQLMSVALNVQSGAAIVHVSLKFDVAVTVKLKVDGVLDSTWTAEGQHLHGNGTMAAQGANPGTIVGSMGLADVGRIAFSTLVTGLSAASHTFSVTVTASAISTVSEGSIVVQSCST